MLDFVDDHIDENDGARAADSRTTMHHNRTLAGKLLVFVHFVNVFDKVQCVANVFRHTVVAPGQILEMEDSACVVYEKLT